MSDIATPLTDADFDDIHHALGRPDGPWVTPYRNRFVVGIDSDTAARFLASGCWTLAGTMNGGRDGIFRVTDAGCVALWAWLKAKNQTAGVRPFTVSCGRYSRTVMAKSRKSAVYAYFLQVSDVLDDSFFDFLTRLRPRARLA